jgi:hypothetical protein
MYDTDDHRVYLIGIWVEIIQGNKNRIDQRISEFIGLKFNQLDRNSIRLVCF